MMAKNKKTSKSNVKQKKTSKGAGNHSLTTVIPRNLAVIVAAVMVVLLVVTIIKMYSTVRTEVDYEVRNYSEQNALLVEDVFSRMQNYSSFMSQQMSQIKNMTDQERDKAIETVANVYLTDSTISSASYHFEPDVVEPNTPNGISYVYYYEDGEYVNQKDYDDTDGYADDPNYAAAMEEGATVFSDPMAIESAVTGNMEELVTASTGIFDDSGNFLGVAECSLKLSVMSDYDFADGGYETSCYFIVDETGNDCYGNVNEQSADTYSVDEMTGQEFSFGKKTAEDIIAEFAEEDTDSVTTTSTNPMNGKKAYTSYAKIDLPDGGCWISVFDVDKSEALSNIKGAVAIIVILMILGTAAIIALCIFMIRNALKPITSIMALGSKMSSGDMSKSDLRITTGDEFQSLAEVFNQTSDTMGDYINEISGILTYISQGNLDKGIDRDYIGDFNAIKDSLNQILVSLNATLSEINQAAGNVSAGSEQVSLAAQNLSQGAVSQANAVEELTATIAEVNEQVKKNAEDAITASGETQEMKTEIETSNVHMAELLKAMDIIADRSSQIAAISRTIEDIAFQTNILALNAAVEAARAGSAGKGFAVVADEVRNLANKSGEAAASTTELIKASLEAVDMGKNMADQTAEVLSKAVGATEGIVERIDVIAADAKEQASSIAQINVGIDQIAGVVQTNSATAEETAASSQELSAQAQYMRQLVERFRLRQ